MKSLSLPSAVIVALGLGIAAPSFAQSQPQTTDDTWRMPYERGFWGHAGLSVGRGDLDASCPAGFGCDLRDHRVWRAYAGGRFNNAIGLELGAINIGDYSRGGGVTDGWGLDFALVAGVPIGANSAIFGKLGAIYARTEVTGVAPGFATGKEQDLGLRYGVGAQIGFTPKWALRADWDRYDLPLPGGREELDVFLLGVQYTFR
jgi:hypothetical protein